MKPIHLDTVQKEILLLGISFFIASAVIGEGCLMAGRSNVPEPDEENKGIIRLHVIANSNSREDQLLKLKVRNEIVKSLKAQKTPEDSRQYIVSHLDDIAETAEKTIVSGGFDYGAEASLGVFYIPEKRYEDLVLPGGNYEALRIVLGQGRGRNWWCVIFPNLCLPESSQGQRGCSGDAGDGLVIRSKVKEKLRAQVSSRSQRSQVSWKKGKKGSNSEHNRSHRRIC